jgi:hypothetical protein
VCYQYSALEEFLRFGHKSSIFNIHNSWLHISSIEGVPLPSFYHKTFPVPIYTHPKCLDRSLNVQGRGLALGDELCVRLDGGGNLGGGELLDLLRGTADESAGVKEGVELGNDGLEEGSAANTLDQVVVLALLLDVVGGLVGEDTCNYV